VRRRTPLHLPDVRLDVDGHDDRMHDDQTMGEGVVFQRARLRDRLVARVRAARLDDELARGVAPEASVALLLRAQTLIAPSTRAALATQIQRILRDALSSYVWVISRVTPPRRAVLDAADELEALAHRLVEPGPVSADGVARVRLLLTDGCGPLYAHGASQRLRTVVASARDSLEPRLVA
jgi:hypothetical protein